ncbi:hypothetical protein AB0H73_08210 [Streptomyces olivoreticuli]
MTTATRHRVVRIAADHTAVLEPVDVEAVRSTVRKILGSVPSVVLGADDLTTAITDLTAHLDVLMPIVARTHPELVASIRRRLEYTPPDANRYPVCARRWVEESARSADQLLDLATIRGKARWGRAGVAEP